MVTHHVVVRRSRQAIIRAPRRHHHVLGVQACARAARRTWGDRHRVETGVAGR